MFFESKDHIAYKKQQRVRIGEHHELIIKSSQLIQRDFANFILHVELPVADEKIDLTGTEVLCYYGESLVSAKIGALHSYSLVSSDNGIVIKQRFVCKKIKFATTCTPTSSCNSVDYIIPYSKIELFDNYTDCLNGYTILDSIFISGKKASWQIKNLISIEDGDFSISPLILGKEHSFSNHLILTTKQPFSSDINEEAYNIAYLLQLALGNLALPACKIIRCDEQIFELESLCTPNKIPCFWSPLGRSHWGEKGRIKQYIENALACFDDGKLGEAETWRAILATYATMNMRHVHLQHRLLFSYLLLDSLYNIFVTEEFQEESNTQQLNYNANELKKDLTDVFSKHGIPNPEKCSHQVTAALNKQGQGRTKVPSFDLRVLKLFSKFDCPPPNADDLKHRNDIMHEGKLKIKGTGEQLKLMTRIFNAVTQLLFAILQYKGTVNYVPENNWQVIK